MVVSNTRKLRETGVIGYMEANKMADQLTDSGVDLDHYKLNREYAAKAEESSLDGRMHNGKRLRAGVDDVFGRFKAPTGNRDPIKSDNNCIHFENTKDGAVRVSSNTITFPLRKTIASHKGHMS